MPSLTLHMLPFSHPCLTVEAALRFKGLAYDRVVLTPPHADTMKEIYGVERGTVPGMLVDGEPVHGSLAILERLEALAPAPTLYPPPIADAVRAAERWGDGELQDLGRRIPWGALHFRPEALSTFNGAPPLDPAGVDFAIRFIRATWRYHGVTAERVAADLAALPALLDHVDALAADGVIGGEQPTAADLQIGSSLRILLAIGDLEPLFAGRPAERIARRWFPEYSGNVPSGAFPAGWVPVGASADAQDA